MERFVPRCCHFLKTAKIGERRTFIKELKNILSERDQQALYNRRLNIKDSFHVLSDKYGSVDFEQLGTGEMPRSFNLSFTKSKMAFKASVN